jgi:hypothetical protein
MARWNLLTKVKAPEMPPDQTGLSAYYEVSSLKLVERATSLHVPPLAAFGSHAEASHRIFMSATLTDEAFLVQRLQFMPDNPLTYAKQSRSGVLRCSNIRPNNSESPACAS